MISRIWTQVRENPDLCLFLANIPLIGVNLVTSTIPDTVASVAIATLQSAAYYALCKKHESFGSVGAACVFLGGIFSFGISSVATHLWLNGSVQLTRNKALWATANFLATGCFLHTAYYHGEQTYEDIHRSLSTST